MKCDRCEAEFSPDEAPGGLFFGMPVSKACRKYHLCQRCTRAVTAFIQSPDPGTRSRTRTVEDVLAVPKDERTVDDWSVLIDARLNETDDWRVYAALEPLASR